jgi:hypothetical protein
MDPMLRKALRKHNGLRQQMDNVLLGDNGDMWEAELRKFLAQRPCWVEKPVPSILKLVGTVVVPATTTKFVAKDKFVVNTKSDTPVKISHIWDNFKGWFLSGNGKIEDPIGEQTLRYHKLLRSSVDGSIIAELGCAEKSETTLSEMFFLMEQQKNGEAGILLNNGYASIFYIKDQSGALRAVLVRWRGGGWFVRAHSVEGPDGWFGGCRVFSRNS